MVMGFSKGFGFVFTLGAEIQPGLNYAGQPGIGYNGTLIRSGMLKSLSAFDYTLDMYVGGQTYGMEWGVGNFINYPFLRMKTVNLGLYAGLDVGIGLFRPHPVMAYAVQAGLKYSIYMNNVYWVFNIGVRYHDSPWYSANVSPMSTIDLPLYFGMEWRGNSSKSRPKQKVYK